MVNRREFLGITVGAGATLAFTPELLRALQQSSGKLIQRAIPSSGEMLPVIALHRGSGSGAAAKNTLDASSADYARIKEVIKALVDSGGKVVDSVHGGPAAQAVTGMIANELGVQNKIFWSTPVSVSGDPAAVKAQLETAFTSLKVPRIDLVMVIAIGTANISTNLAVLREMKKEGRVRYIGVTDLLPPQTMNLPVVPDLESIMRNEPIDFVGFDYSVGDRRAEQTLLPLAEQRKIGVLSYFPFDRARGLRRVGNTPLPEWAAEFDARTWAQFFLKYVLSHPAVTVVRTGTSNATHMIDNIGGGIGRLPSEATRKRMAAFIDALPPTAPR